MKTVILCGGRGTRAFPHTIEVPKPLLEIGGRPMLQHVMELYAAQGFADFVLAAGYKVEQIEAFAAGMPPAWKIDVVDTGDDTGTGGRIAGVREHVDGTFFCTYADGLGDVDLHDLRAFHDGHAQAATLTTVPLQSQYGTVELDGDGRVVRFREKPRLPEHRINAGFFVFDERVFDLWFGDDLERQTLPHLARLGELAAYHHEGFWKSADTYKDTQELASLWETGAPWLPNR